jgi:hypothetical protein
VRSVSFNIYDSDRDGLITQADIIEILTATLREHEIVISDREIQEIVENTMRETVPETLGHVSFAEYVPAGQRVRPALTCSHVPQISTHSQSPPQDAFKLVTQYLAHDI